MLNAFRPPFEVVKEGRILKKIKHIQRQNVKVLRLAPVWCQDLNENGMVLAEKMSWEYFSPNKRII